ncbi:hypothetical protein DBV05_g100 [Lasiodiplodia theobromae]|uniref:Uncharacterized protein n=1 Tax=Lasiodiplodia theobromae TaxID=45133 RepID=A0A5N5DTX1_9PEZI|nr:hypothetical protein DBV05_g100 [Lasiodiplodia theobromae]
MPCSNPEHDHWWVGTFTPLEPSPDTEPKSESPIPEINGRLVITLERCERMCGLCPVNERRKFRSAQKVVQHVNRSHKELKTDGTIVRIRPMEDRGRRPGAKGVSMRDSDKKYEWRDGSWERRDQGEDEEDEDELDPLSTEPEMDDDDDNHDAKHKVGDARRRITSDEDAMDEDFGYGDDSDEDVDDEDELVEDIVEDFMDKWSQGALSTSYSRRN